MAFKFTRTLSACDRCPLRDERRVWGCGPRGAKAVLLGEAPGAEEARDGSPFVGWAGRFLSKTLFEMGVRRDDVWLSNTIVCRPPSNDIRSPEAVEAIKCCSAGFWEEIEELVGNGATVIGALGNTPLSALKITDLTITKARGSVFELPLGADGTSLDNVRTIHVVPTFHPSFVNRLSRNPEGRDPISYDAVWRADLGRIVEISTHGWHPWPENFNISPSLSDVTAFVDDCLSNNRIVAVDIETTGIDPTKDHIIVIGLSSSPDSSLSVPLLGQYANYYWKSDEEPVVRSELNRLFAQGRFAFHYSPFDVPFLTAHGFNLPPARIKHDTYLLQLALNPGLPLRLGFVVSLYGTTPYWKEDFTGRTVPITYLPDDVLRTYNCRDAATLHQIFPTMMKKLSSEGLAKYDSYMDRLPSILDKQIAGHTVSEEKVSRYAARLSRDLIRKEKELRSAARLPDHFNFQSGDDMRYFLYGLSPSKFNGLDEKMAEKKRRDTKAYEELERLKELRDEVKPFAKLSVSNPSVKEDKLETVLRVIDRRLQAISDMKRDKSKHDEEAAGLRKMRAWIEGVLGMNAIRRKLVWFKVFETLVNFDGRVRLGIPMSEIVTGQLSDKNKTLLEILKDCEA